MIKKLALTGITLTALLLTGCGGGGGGSTDPMKEKNYIIILNDVTSGICESEAFTQELSAGGFTDFLTRETDNSTNCGTYDKTNNDVECTTQYIGGSDKNCVVGFNDIPAGYSGLARQTGPVQLFDTVDLVSQSF